MRWIAAMTLAACGALAGPSEAQAQRISADVRIGLPQPSGRWVDQQQQVFVPGGWVTENKVVQVPGYWESFTRHEEVPGRWEVTYQNVESPGRWEVRTRHVTQPGHWTVDRYGCRQWVPPCTRTVSERVWIRGAVHQQPVRRWVPPCTREVQDRRWVPPCTRTEQVRVWREGHYTTQTTRLWVTNDAGCSTPEITAQLPIGRRGGFQVRIGR